MTTKNEIIINNFKDELIFALSLKLENNLTDECIYQLDYEKQNLESIIDSFSQDEDLSFISECLNLSNKIIKNYYKKKDNETLRKKQFYVTVSQLEFLDSYAEEKNLGGKGRRSLALRNILNEKMKKEV
ncbi:hypothetical protein [Methanobrevibacter curvatus]|nr:hypothetical protein [Methanobrevibacter curvatus]